MMNNLIAKKPLIICDVDEVVLHFVKPFEEYLSAHNHELRKQSFKLGGNVFNRTTGEALSHKEASELVQSFHVSHVDQQPLVDGADESLNRLQEHCQIVFLTNVEQSLADRRTKHLESLGLPFPLIANKGSKAEAVSTLKRQTDHTVIFIDDLPMHHELVKKAEPATHCIHFMADQAFKQLVTIREEIARQAHSWDDVERMCLSAISQHQAMT